MNGIPVNKIGIAEKIEFMPFLQSLQPFNSFGCYIQQNGIPGPVDLLLGQGSRSYTDNNIPELISRDLTRFKIEQCPFGDPIFPDTQLPERQDGRLRVKSNDDATQVEYHR